MPKKICLAVELPPPVNGMSNVNKHVVDMLKAEESVFVYNLSAGEGRSAAVRKLRKAWAVIWAVILIACRPVRFHTVYAVANARHGLAYNIAIALAARLRKTRLVLHHHTFGYIHEYDWRIALVVRLMTPTDVHVLLCHCMKTQFQQRYGERSQCLVVSNPIDIAPGAENSRAARSDPSRLVLGHLSNLTNEKGLDAVLEGFCQLVADGYPVDLVLAGPAGPDERQAIEEAVQRTSGHLHYLGPVYGENKRRFFESIDMFLFPTRYRNEAQPLVVVEALACGVPVIATDRACIQELISSGGGVAAASDEYQRALRKVVDEVLENEGSLQRRSEQARGRGADLISAARRDFATLASVLTAQ